MAFTEIFKERVETLGVGKAKATFFEVLVGGHYDGTDMDEDSGTPHTKIWSTGATIDNPYGLQLVSLEVCIDRKGVGAGSALFQGAYALVQDPEAESGEGLLQEDNYKVQHLVTTNIGRSAMEYTDGTNNGMPLYAREDFHLRPIQKLFTAPTLPLEVVAFSNASSSSDLIEVTAKFTFKKVKMTKNAYLEKLALRAYT